MGMNNKGTFNWAEQQESFLRDKIGNPAFDLLEMIEKNGRRLSAMKPKNPGWVWLDKAFFPFVSFERAKGRYEVQVPRLRCNRKTGKYTTKVKKYVVACEQIKWRPGFEGNIV